MHTTTERVEAPFASVVHTEGFDAREDRIRLRGTYRISVRKLHGHVFGFAAYVLVGSDGRPRHAVDGESARACYEICVDGRKAAVAHDMGGHGWFVEPTNEDGQALNADLPQAIGSMVRAFCAGIDPDAEAAAVFDAWSREAEIHADARVHLFFPGLRSA